MLSTITTITLQAALVAAACVPASNLIANSNTNVAASGSSNTGSSSTVSSDGAINIYPKASNKFCLDVQGNVQADGTPVQVYECNGTG